MNKSEWPIIGVDNLEKTINYYSEILRFEYLAGKDINQDKEVKMKLFDFLIILRSGKKGPILEPGNSQKRIQSKQPILFIPVPEPKRFFGELKSKGANIVSPNEFIDYDLEGFNVIDNEDNKLFFFRDYHGPYNSHLWKWEWELAGK